MREVLEASVDRGRGPLGTGQTVRTPCSGNIGDLSDEWQMIGPESWRTAAGSHFVPQGGRGLFRL